MANTIYRGPTADQSKTITAPVAGAYLPGSFVTYDGTEFTQAAAPAGRLMLLTNREFYTQTVTDAYAADETGMAYRLEPEDEYQAVFAAGSYTYGQELTVNASGQLAAAASTNLVVGFFDGAGATLTANQLGDFVVANYYVKA